jgi:hypothetical protein
MKVTYRQAIGAILTMGPAYQFSGLELQLLLHFLALLGDERIDLEAEEIVDREALAKKLHCTNAAYVSRLFGKLEEKSVIVSTQGQNKSFRSLHPAFAEAIRSYA